MSILNENISIKIKEVLLISWDTLSVNVAARPYHALAFRIAGSASFLSGDTTADTSPGDIFYMPAGCSYSATYQDKNEILVIHFESDLNSKMENFELNNSHLISMLFQKAYDIWNKKENGYYYSALSLMCEILENIAIRQTSVLHSETLKTFEKAIAYMEKNYLLYDFSIEKMVSIACMSNTYFRKLFAAKFGTTPAKYITSKKLIYADNLLASGKYSVKQAAEMSGFWDVKYFSRVVKKEYGTSPSKLYCHIIE